MEPTREEHVNRYLKQAVDHIQAINELDYGDFMRLANMDILKLREAFKREGATVRKKIDEMQLYTQFYPSWEIEPTRDRLLRDIKELEEMLHASLRSSHSGPHSPF